MLEKFRANVLNTTTPLIRTVLCGALCMGLTGLHHSLLHLHAVTDNVTLLIVICTPFGKEKGENICLVITYLFYLRDVFS